jgi:hypothetical protein
MNDPRYYLDASLGNLQDKEGSVIIRLGSFSTTTIAIIVNKFACVCHH